MVPGHRPGVGGEALLRRARFRVEWRARHRRALPQRARLFASPLPVVAAVQGAAIGGGLGLAMSADFRMCSAGSRLSANFARLGFHHGFALSVTLPRTVGHQTAADLLLTGRRVGGEEAVQLGLCDVLVDDAVILERATDHAATIAASGPLAVRSIRQTLRRGLLEQTSAGHGA